ncbi:MAG: STAS domain-containing protein [Chloroflexi bacterium]|nr:STAS domain-containing protein [Chloroflexota bacterium]
MATISVSKIKSVRIIEIIGRLDGDTAPEMGQMLDQAIDQGDCQLVLDLGSVDYVSSPGLREIVRIFKRAQQLSGDLRIANPSDRVMEILELAGLDTTLEIHPSRIAAVNSF